MEVSKKKLEKWTRDLVEVYDTGYACAFGGEVIGDDHHKAQARLLKKVISQIVDIILEEEQK